MGGWVIIRGSSSSTEVVVECVKCRTRLIMAAGTTFAVADSWILGFSVDHRPCGDGK
jgi:hypothetical protein